MLFKRILFPQNGNIIIKFKKNVTELETASGIILPNVEQDMNVAEVVRIPSNKQYWYKVYDALGTPVRAADGVSIKEALGTIDLNVGDKVLIERRNHADYGLGPNRNVIPHCVAIPLEWEDFNDDEHDYFFIRYEDVLGTYEGSIRENDIHGELYPVAKAVPIKLKSR